ncbi:hypothetical protein D3C75_720330 [compost metagenome]
MSRKTDNPNQTAACLEPRILPRRPEHYRTATDGCRARTHPCTGPDACAPARCTRPPRDDPYGPQSFSASEKPWQSDQASPGAKHPDTPPAQMKCPDATESVRPAALLWHRGPYASDHRDKSSDRSAPASILSVPAHGWPSPTCLHSPDHLDQRWQNQTAGPDRSGSIPPHIHWAPPALWHAPPSPAQSHPRSLPDCGGAAPVLLQYSYPGPRRV